MSKKHLAKIGLSLLGLVAMVSCGGTASSEENKGAETVAATLTGNYISQATITYLNFRPTYNYYLTTFSFYSLETYSDNTYVLSESSSTFTAINLPSEGNEAVGNENTNYLTKYYGTIVSDEVPDPDLDPTSHNLKLGVPTRIVSAYDSQYYIDTDNWNDNMKTNSADKTYGYDETTQQQVVTGTIEYDTGADYLAAHAYKETTVGVDTSTYKLVSITLDFTK